MASKKEASSSVTIAAPNIQTISVNIVGTAPYVQHKFSQKARRQMLEKQMAGSTAKGKKNKESRDIDQDYIDAMHLDSQDRHGIPAPAFRSAMISACRLCGFQMTKAKLSVFIVHDTVDADDGTPLVFINGTPELHEASVRLETGVASVSIRPMWREWSANLKIRYDADQFTQTDVVNLLARAGLQVGVGEGRPDSKKSHGMGWGTFEIAGD